MCCKGRDRIQVLIDAVFLLISCLFWFLLQCPSLPITQQSADRTWATLSNVSSSHSSERNEVKDTRWVQKVFCHQNDWIHREQVPAKFLERLEEQSHLDLGSTTMATMLTSRKSFWCHCHCSCSITDPLALKGESSQQKRSLPPFTLPTGLHSSRRLASLGLSPFHW
jgi:hypothetical protein